MPYIVTEPQRIDGTTLGYAIYPYTFSFHDQFENPNKLSQKLLLFRLKDSPFIEIDRVVYEKEFPAEKVSIEPLTYVLRNFIKVHPEFVTSYPKFDDFTHRQGLQKPEVVK